MKRVYKMKKTISMRQFITEFGEDFSKHMKQRLMELGERCLLTRKDGNFILDLKHIEHSKYDCSPDSAAGDARELKEYAYGQFVMNEGTLYFSEQCIENAEVMQCPGVRSIYASLDSEAIVFDQGIKAKKVDDRNIDYVVDRILEVCPEISPEHMAIISRY